MNPLLQELKTMSIREFFSDQSKWHQGSSGILLDGTDAEGFGDFLDDSYPESLKAICLGAAICVKHNTEWSTCSIYQSTLKLAHLLWPETLDMSLPEINDEFLDYPKLLQLCETAQI